MTQTAPALTAQQLAQYLDALLQTNTIPDYSNAINGLQLDNQQPIRKVAASVDLSTQTINSAIQAGANLMVVHHGMFWGGLQPIRGPYYHRLKRLMDNDIAVYSAHLPLDCHPLYGNNVLLAQTIDLNPTEIFAQYKNISIGVRGQSDVATIALASKLRTFAQSHGGEIRTTPIFTEQRTRNWAICTGGGANSDTLREATDLGIDTLIVGEGPHHTAVDAQEIGVTVIYAGHYATETLGVQTIAKHISEQFSIPWTFVAAPTGL